MLEDGEEVCRRKSGEEGLEGGVYEEEKWHNHEL